MRARLYIITTYRCLGSLCLHSPASAQAKSQGTLAGALTLLVHTCRSVIFRHFRRRPDCLGNATEQCFSAAAAGDVVFLCVCVCDLITNRNRKHNPRRTPNAGAYGRPEWFVLCACVCAVGIRACLCGCVFERGSTRSLCVMFACATFTRIAARRTGRKIRRRSIAILRFMIQNSCAIT